MRNMLKSTLLSSNQNRTTPAVLLAPLLLVACGSQSPPVRIDDPPTSSPPPSVNYTPAPVFCADTSVSDLCSVIPSFIGSDPALLATNGYQGLSKDVTSAKFDAQSPFDNMAWQMFVAMNWQAGGAGSPATGLTGAGPVVWQSYARPEDVFGGPIGVCKNPKNLPRFNIIAKSGAQGSRDEEFIQATGQPLIDRIGNWTLFERRLNGVEQQYIQSQGLNTYQGQQTFVSQGNTVLFPPGQQVPTNGSVGAIELKAAWRIITAAEASSYFHIQALIDVQGAFVRNGKPICDEVTLGLVGLHIIQANSEIVDQSGKNISALNPAFIWASFEHKSNAPNAAKPCAATDNNCYQNITNNNCPAPSNATNMSYFNAACNAVTVNTPPALKPGEQAFVWEPSQPYAASYMTSSNNTQCGTQVSRCWATYDLTAKLNQAWQAKLQAINSVFANYHLIGTNWGANIEPEYGVLDNNSVPAFLGNMTMETYIQADPKFGACVNCHAGATLAYTTKDSKGNTVSYPANFSFLLGLAKPQMCQDVQAGPIYNNSQAQQVCPKVCKDVNKAWNGQWKTTVVGQMSVCGCCNVSAEKQTN